MTEVLFKGGRSKKAPYETTHVRVPVPIQLTIQRIVDLYKITVASGDCFSPASFVNDLTLFLKGYHSFAGTLVRDTETLHLDELSYMKQEIVDLTESVNHLKLQIHFHEQARLEFKELLEEACLLKPNAGGAIKKKIREVIDSLD